MGNPVSFEQYSGTAAENYERYFVPAIGAPVAEDLLRVSDLRVGERVLDVACGTGVVARMANEGVGPTGQVVGVDVATDMVEVARSIPVPSGAPIEWREADAASLPFYDGSFDVVLCQMGLMFFPDQPAALVEMRRVLDADGRVVINTPGTISRPMEILADGLEQHIDPNLAGFVHAVFSMHDPSALDRLLTDAGFREVDVTVTPTMLQLPPPRDFMWQYISATPLSGFLSAVPESTRAELEADVVDRWERHLARDPGPVEQSMVFATARR